MKYLKITFLFLLFSIIIFKSSFSQALIKFEKSTHDFGKIKENLGKAEARFEFTNAGDKDLIIKNVRTSCGCTGSGHTEAPVKPGEKGFVKAIYHTKRRPGTFRKSIVVTYNNPDKPTSVLFIKGVVIPNRDNEKNLYGVTSGNLKLKTNNFNFGKISTNDKKTDSIKVMNAGEKVMELKTDNLPKHLKVKITNHKLKKDEVAYIIVTYDAKKKGGYGKLYDTFNLLTNDETYSKKTISVFAELQQDYSNLTEKQKKKAPIVTFETKEYNFGTVKSGEAVKYSFKIKNKGKSDLKIFRIQPGCGCTTTNVEKMIIKRRKSSTIDVVFDTKGRLGKQNKSIKVITNDPVNPIITLQITGAVVK